MKLGLINSAFAQANKGTKFGLEQTKRIGFDTVDIFTDPLDIDAKERKLIKSTCTTLKLPIKSICCVAVGLIDFNPPVARFHVERVKRYLDVCKEVGCDNLLLVIGEYIWEQQVVPASEQWAYAVENTRTLGEYARSLGLEIAIEMEPFKLSLVRDVPTALKFLDDVALPNVMANCDISHLHLVRTPPSDVAKLKGRIAHVHLSDCDGKVHGDLPPGRGITPVKDYLRAIRDTGFDRTVSIELEFSPQPDRIVEWVEEAYRETDRIMRELNCRG
jgi:sugar phosphate isomerase/epimerase